MAALAVLAVFWWGIAFPAQYGPSFGDRAVFAREESREVEIRFFFLDWLEGLRQ